MLAEFGLEPTRARSIEVGQVYGQLTVLAFGQVPGTYIYKAVCQCSCGSAPKAIRFDGLKSGAVVACGCIQKARTTTHGLTKSGHYDRWRHMMDRCYDPKCPAYPDYGGRGIQVCREWHTLGGFVAGLPAGYARGLDIDRIDNNGDYEPGNIRWVTRATNNDNRRSGRVLEFDGRSQSLTAWARELGMRPGLISERLNLYGWTAEQALTTPPLSDQERMARARASTKQTLNYIPKPKAEPRQPLRFEYRGEARTLAEIARLSGVDVKLLRKRVCERGWSIERATAPP